MLNYNKKQLSEIIPTTGRAAMLRAGVHIWAGPGAFLVRLNVDQIPGPWLGFFPAADGAGVCIDRAGLEDSPGYGKSIAEMVAEARQAGGAELTRTIILQQEFQTPMAYGRAYDMKGGRVFLNEDLIHLVHDIADRSGAPITGQRAGPYSSVVFYAGADPVAIVCRLRLPGEG